MLKINFKNKRVKHIVIAGVSAVVVLSVTTGIVMVSLAKSVTSTTTFRPVQAATGSISNYISESGTASDSAEYALTASNAGTVDSVSVSQGDTVTKGQVLAHISETTTSENLATKQNSLTSAKSDLASAEDSVNNLYVKAAVAGRIKSVKVEAGDDASSISNAFGYLMYLSISGQTQISISSPQQSLKSGDSVEVAVGSSTYSGVVSSSSSSSSNNQGGSNSGITVTVYSDEPAVGDSATVTKNGSTVGTGTIALTSDAIKITASGSSSGSSSGSGGSSSSSSTVTEVYVTEGETVSKGTKLFKYDDASVQKTITQKQTAVAQAEKEVENAQSAVDKDTITSPADGVVASLSVKAGDSIQNGGSIATIIDQNQMQTVLSVDEDDISSIKAGQSVKITLDAISNKTFSGKVTKVNTLGTTSNNVTTYSVTVSIDNPSGINVGMTTNADIITESKDNTVIVNSSAILEKQGNTGYVIKSGSLSGVKSLKNITTRELVQKYGTKVTLGLSNANQVEVTEGLSSGDTVEIPVTVNLSAVKSLKTTSSSSSNSMGGPGGMGGDMGGGGGAPGGTAGGGTTGGTGGKTQQKSGGTGNTVG